MAKLTIEQLQAMRKSFEGCPSNTIAQNAVMKNGLRNSAVNQEACAQNTFFFSENIDSEPVTNQRMSGRCWMFAALNTLRHRIEKKYNVKDVVLSQNYTFFYDKIEKCNIFYEHIIRTADKSLDDREVLFLLNMPQQDGGDWCLIAAIIDKYGVVPQSAMGETACSMTSAELDTILNTKLRQDAVKLRKMVAEKATTDDIQKVVDAMLAEDYRILAIALGNPPEQVRWEYYDKDNKYHSSGLLTPHDFYHNYIGIDLNDYVGIINVPIPSMPLHKLYTVEFSGNMVGGRPNLYYNTTIERLAELTATQLKDGEPVWFGCDVMQSSSIPLGIMAMDMYNLEALLNINFTMTKGERFAFRDSLPTHAMTFAGYDEVDGKITKWKVENSWGTKDHPDKGYLIMSNDWFENYNYECVINKKYLNAEELKAFEGEPVVLPFWNAMNPI